MKAIVQHSIKVMCHTCDGVGSIEETAYPNREKVIVTCPECFGKKYVTMMSLPEESELKLPLVVDEPKKAGQ